MEVLSISDEDSNDIYNVEYEKHNGQITKLEEQVKATGKTARTKEKAKASGITTQDLMNKARNLQEVQE